MAGIRTEQEIREKLEYVKGNNRGSAYSYVQETLEWVLGSESYLMEKLK